LGGCEKSELQELNSTSEIFADDADETKQNAEVMCLYFIDNEPADEISYNRYVQQTEEPFIVHRMNLNDKTNEPIENIHCFSTENAYINFGEKMDINLKGKLEFESLMKEYVEKHNIEQIFEATGIIPKEYLDYEAECHKKIFGENTKANSISFYNDSNGNGVPLNVFHTLAVVGPPYNDNIESFKVNGLVAYNFSVYNRRFYIGRLATYTGRVYWEHLEEMSSGVKNKTSSINKWW
jgi:hypothetical protein